MKSPYIWIAVFFRVVAVCVALFGCFSVSTSFVVASSAGSGLNLPLMLMRFLFLYLLCAVILWLISRPVARFIVRDLDRD